MALKFVFAIKILHKNCNNIESGILKLVRTGLKIIIANMFYIKALLRVLILVLFIYISIILICLVKTYF